MRIVSICGIISADYSPLQRRKAVVSRILWVMVKRANLAFYPFIPLPSAASLLMAYKIAEGSSKVHAPLLPSFMVAPEMLLLPSSPPPLFCGPLSSIYLVKGA